MTYSAPAASNSPQGPSRTSSECSRVDRGADGQDWRQEIMELVQAEVDEHVVHYKKIIASKNKRIRELKRQLAKTKTQPGRTPKPLKDLLPPSLR